ncbi:MAG: hypothetical protein A3J74_03695 [Elusimicrobia bacterium RIFCSPHIGHO2_02_FULL_57_9]|nr:MAG: hypothetical protein A3J74_03695 [Elusimicrobia bacterium RIFCSPHIGHO2_02_FULL_57_9]
MPELSVNSHRGPYKVIFGNAFEGLEKGLADNEHLIIDAKVAELYEQKLGKALQGDCVLRIEATEANKSLEQFPGYAAHLLEHGIRRSHSLVAVGGGIIQDITAFLAATLLRGLAWRFYPTTLLAQADSCIGSKSSVNVGAYKNQLGTFTPPDEIRISTDILDTLSEADMRSGIGEMIKVHIISSLEDARRLAKDYPHLLKDGALLSRALVRSLEIKKNLIEIDEFDRKERLAMNYGHSFGHALESATDYAVPHGIGVTIGMDMANRLSQRLGLLENSALEELSPMIQANYAGFESLSLPENRFISALEKDKKNSGPAETARFVLLRRPGEPVLKDCLLNNQFKEFCRGFFKELSDRAALGAPR